MAQITLKQWLTDNSLVEYDLIQGTDEWLEFRLNYDGASEAAPALGISKKTPRSEMQRMKYSGLPKEFSEYVQKNILDYGHEVEALARPIVESQLGINLYPVVCSRGRMSASCDGITMNGKTGWEHKQWNAMLAAAVTAKELPDEFMAQPQQCLLVTGAEKWIFTVSDGTETNMVSMEILPDQTWFKRIYAGWLQFHKDMEGYVPVEALPAAVAEPTLDLPSVSIMVEGSVALVSNLDKFGVELKSFISKIPENPSTDQEFANCKAAITSLQKAQNALDAAEASAMAQIASFDDMRRTKKLYFDLARDTRLMVEKLVVARELAIKGEIMQESKDELAAHVATLNTRLGKPYMPAVVGNFVEAIKNKRSIATMREAANNELLHRKMDASAIADKIEINLNSLRELAADFTFLFADMHELVLKDNDAVVAIASNRIAEHRIAKAAEEEALRAKLQAEEEVKARTKLEEELRADAEARAKIEIEAAEKLRKEQLATHATQSEAVVEPADAKQAPETRPAPVWPFPTIPSRIQMIEAVAKTFNLTYSAAEQCMREEFSEITA
jgi:predicted phage-related endonuclease